MTKFVLSVLCIVAVTAAVAAQQPQSFYDLKIKALDGKPGNLAQYKGKGTVNGVTGFSFMLTARDGQVSGGGGSDGIRMKIWNTATNVLIYDNVTAAVDDKATVGNTQVIDNGSIVIHK